MYMYVCMYIIRKSHYRIASYLKIETTYERSRLSYSDSNHRLAHVPDSEVLPICYTFDGDLKIHGRRCNADPVDFQTILAIFECGRLWD